MILYNLRKTDLGYRITKFSDDLNIESSYDVTHSTCSCPQSHRPTCRHRKMLPIMISKVDTEWFFCYEDASWHRLENLSTELTGEGPGPSTFAVESTSSPSQASPPDLRGEPVSFSINALEPILKRRL